MKLKAVFFTGLLVGSIDAIAAIAIFKIKGGGDIQLIPKYIASAIFGMNAFRGGTTIVFSGILFHYIIAMLWTLFFFLIHPAIRGICPNRYVCGGLYGLVIWSVMNLIVVPLSNAPQAPRMLMDDLTGIAILITAVGLPISLIQHRQVLPDKSTSH